MMRDFKNKVREQFGRPPKGTSVTRALPPATTSRPWSACCSRHRMTICSTSPAVAATRPCASPRWCAAWWLPT